MENHIIMNMLKKIIEDKKIIEVYNNKKHPGNCIVGTVSYADNYSILINSISLDGRYDGYIAIKTEDIFELNIDTSYINEIIEKMESNYIEHEKIEQISSNQIANLLFYSKKCNKSVSITLYNSDLVDAYGIVEDIDENYIVVRTANSGGVSIIFIDSISEIDCDGENENNF